MSDVLILEFARTVFWLIALGVVLFLFHGEIKMLLQSLGSFKVAGATFELKDRKETLQSYVLLAETLIDILSRSERIDALQQIVLPNQIEKLGVFAIKYTEEVGNGQWNEELLRNIAYLLLRFGRYSQSVKLYDALLVRRPNHVDLLNLKALALLTSRLDDNVSEARNILLNLVLRYPEVQPVRFNFALAQSLLGDHDEVEKQISKLIELEYFKQAPNFLDDPLWHRTNEIRPDLIKLAKEKLSI